MRIREVTHDPQVFRLRHIQETEPPAWEEFEVPQVWGPKWG